MSLVNGFFFFFFGLAIINHHLFSPRFMCLCFSFSFFFPKDISFTIWYLWKWKKKRKAIAIRPAFGGEDTRLPTKQTRTQVRSLVVGSCLLLLSRSMEKTMCPILKTRQSEHRFSCLAPGQDWTRLFINEQPLISIRFLFLVVEPFVTTRKKRNNPDGNECSLPDGVPVT